MSYEPSQVTALAIAAMEVAPAITELVLARQLGIDRGTLGAIVLATTGKKFRELRDELITRRFVLLLRDGRPRSVKEISSALGFASDRSFRGWVQRHYQATPVQLRSSLSAALSPDGAARRRGAARGR